MPLLPMNDTIFGDPVSEDGFDELTQLFMDASREFRALNESMESSLYVEERKLTAQLEKKTPLYLLCHVTAVGPDCRDLKIGDTAILPPYGGTMITVYDEGGEPRRVFCISERAVLARYTED